MRLNAYSVAVHLIQIYQCFCDETRLRIIHLLTKGPLCVCHFQDILEVPQTKVSQHLAYLRKRELVECKRRGAWMIYSLPARPSPELEMNLKCLQDCAQTNPVFRADLEKLPDARRSEAKWLEEAAQKNCDCQ